MNPTAGGIRTSCRRATMYVHQYGRCLSSLLSTKETLSIGMVTRKRIARGLLYGCDASLEGWTPYYSLPRQPFTRHSVYRQEQLLPSDQQKSADFQAMPRPASVLVFFRSARPRVRQSTHQDRSQDRSVSSCFSSAQIRIAMRTHISQSARMWCTCKATARMGRRCKTSAQHDVRCDATAREARGKSRSTCTR